MKKFVVILFMLISYSVFSQRQMPSGGTAGQELQIKPDGFNLKWGTPTGGTVTSVGAVGSTGINVTGSPITTSGTFTITNTSPDQIVVLNAGNGISINSAYPTFTITNASPVSGITATPPLLISTNTISITQSGASTNGYLSSTDWNTFNNKEVRLTFSTGLTRTTNTVTVNTSQNISTLSNLTSNGFVKTSGGTGALSIDGNTYLTGNQTINLIGDVTGSGTTTITTTAAGTIVKTVSLVTPNVIFATPVTYVTTANVATGTLTLNTQSPNTFLAGATSGTATPTFRAIVAEDIPTLNQNTTGTSSNVTGIILPSHGGTGIANNDASTTTISGSFSRTVTLTAATNNTYPTSGTLYGTQTGSITSSQLATSLTDETGTGSAVFATSPTLTSPSLDTPTLLVLTNATGLPLTTGVIGVLPIANGGTNISTYTTGDIIYASATNVLSKLAIGTTGQQLVVIGGIPAWKTPAATQTTAANPATTTSTTGVMKGLAAMVTPSTSGRINISVTGDMDNSTGSDGCVVIIRYGTGTAPTDGAALTGTTVGSSQNINEGNATGLTTSFSPPRFPLALSAVVTGLTIGTAYWVDISLAAVGGGTARTRNITVCIIES